MKMIFTLLAGAALAFLLHRAIEKKHPPNPPQPGQTVM